VAMLLIFLFARHRQNQTTKVPGILWQDRSHYKQAYKLFVHLMSFFSQSFQILAAKFII
jgi:hypothetical protein